MYNCRFSLHQGRPVRALGIMAKVGGKRNTRKVCKKQVKLSKTRGKFVKVGEIIILAKQGGNVLKQGK